MTSPGGDGLALDGFNLEESMVWDTLAEWQKAVVGD